MIEAFVKRGRLEIIYEILSICRKPTNKTSILYKCNLSYNQLQKYLSYLLSQNLLKSFKGERKQFYQVTEKGKDFLDEYEQLNTLLEKEKDMPTVVRNNHSKNLAHKRRLQKSEESFTKRAVSV